LIIASGNLSRQHINHIIFDEAHGEWETTKAPYGPDDFGRNVTYTYSVLYQYATKVFITK
jgi:hypothetical protein